MLLYVGEDNVLTCTGLQNAVTDAYLDSATVTYALKSTAGTTLASGTYDYVASSDGDYRAVLESSAYTLVDGTVYYLEVTIVGSGLNGFRRIRCTAAYRGEA